MTWVLALLAGSAMAQSVPLGPEFQVNSYTTGYQSRSDIAVFPDGSFVVVWLSEWSGPPWSIRGQRYLPSGKPEGTEFGVETFSPVGPFFNRPHVSGAPDGSFVVVWVDEGSPSDSDYSIQARRFEPDGSPAGDEFQVNTTTTNQQLSPAVSSAADGSFVVVWESQAGVQPDIIKGQRYDPDGIPVDGEFQVNLPQTLLDGRFPAVASALDGGFLVVWQAFPYLVSRHFAPNGAGGAEFEINQSETAGYYPGVSAGQDGSFLVVWDDSMEIVGRRLSDEGMPVAGEFLVNSYTTGNQDRPKITASSAGAFLVTWDSYGSAGGDDSQQSIQGQWLRADGAPIGPQFEVNSYTTNGQTVAAAGVAENGEFIVTWTASTPPAPEEASGIRARRFWAGDVLEIFADGFESGDTSAWPLTVP